MASTVTDKMKIGIIGCGNISGAYFNGAKNTDVLKILACADLQQEVAKKRADEFDCRAMSVKELLATPEIELVINLTIPRAHVDVGLQVVSAGKHVYSEKPFAIDLQSAKQLRKIGHESGLRVGCAPDTFLGAGTQTARQQMDAGVIGTAVAGTAFMCGHGHESWHPNPAFYYDIGGGPMLDMGPYYITALINILGPVKRVAGVTAKTFEERVASSETIRGLKIPVKTSTHLTGSIEFCNGAVVTMIMSFDMWRHSLPCIEIYGTDGSMQVPDPNGFGGSVRVSKPTSDWETIPLGFPNNARIIGVIDMVRAIRNNRPHRVSGELAYHALEVMLAFDQSSQTGRHVNIESSVDRPAPLPIGLNEWEVED